jgi:N6-adenosine-specific RNA methylase IME4
VRSELRIRQRLQDRALALAGRKTYEVTLADPPWHFYNWGADEPGMIHDRERGANKYYPTATLADICALVPPSSPDAVLLMWTVSSHLPEALEVIDAWNFEYKTIAWYYLKTNKSGSPRIGMGYWTRQVGELCLLATKGKPRAPEYRGEPAILIAPRGPRHSEKPAEQYNKIDRLFPGTTRLEMFARAAREGWDVFGNEAPGSIEL